MVIHELTHALQDQRFHAGARDLALQKDTDGGLALHALLEGEATLVMLDYVLDKAGQKLDDVVANPEVLSMLTRRSAARTKRSTPPRRATSPSRSSSRTPKD